MIEAPSLKVCKTPRLLQRYLAILVRTIEKLDPAAVIEVPKEDPTTTFAIGDSVLVLFDDGQKYPGVITEYFPCKEGPDPIYDVYDVKFDDGDTGTFGAEVFC